MAASEKVINNKNVECLIKMLNNQVNVNMYLLEFIYHVIGFLRHLYCSFNKERNKHNLNRSNILLYDYSTLREEILAGSKVGGLAVFAQNRQIKFPPNFKIIVICQIKFPPN